MCNVLLTQVQADKYASWKIYYIPCKKNADAAINSELWSIARVNRFYPSSGDKQPDRMRSKHNQNSRERLQKDSCISHGCQSTSCVLAWLKWKRSAKSLLSQTWNILPVFEDVLGSQCIAVIDSWWTNRDPSSEIHAI